MSVGSLVCVLAIVAAVGAFPAASPTRPTEEQAADLTGPVSEYHVNTTYSGADGTVHSKADNATNSIEHSKSDNATDSTEHSETDSKTDSKTDSETDSLEHGETESVNESPKEKLSIYDFGLPTNNYTLDDDADPLKAEIFRYLTNSGTSDVNYQTDYYATTPRYDHDWTTISYTYVTQSTSQMIGKKIIFKIVWGVGATIFALAVGACAKASRDRKRSIERAAQTRPAAGRLGAGQPSGGSSGDGGNRPSGQEGIALAEQVDGKYRPLAATA